MAESSEPEDAVRVRLNLDGDRDKERRRDRTADPTSTWWTSVGEGSVKVPPPELEYDMVECDQARSSPAGALVVDSGQAAGGLSGTLSVCPLGGAGAGGGGGGGAK